MDRPEKEVREQWFQNPMTKYIIQTLNQGITDYKDAWMEGCFTHETAEGTVQKNSEALGKCQGIEECIEIMEIHGKPEAEDD